MLGEREGVADSLLGIGPRGGPVGAPPRGASVRRKSMRITMPVQKIIITKASTGEIRFLIICSSKRRLQCGRAACESILHLICHPLLYTVPQHIGARSGFEDVQTRVVELEEALESSIPHVFPVEPVEPWLDGLWGWQLYVCVMHYIAIHVWFVSERKQVAL